MTNTRLLLFINLHVKNSLVRCIDLGHSHGWRHREMQLCNIYCRRPYRFWSCYSIADNWSSRYHANNIEVLEYFNVFVNIDGGSSADLTFVQGNTTEKNNSNDNDRFHCGKRVEVETKSDESVCVLRSVRECAYVYRVGEGVHFLIYLSLAPSCSRFR